MIAATFDSEREVVICWRTPGVVSASVRDSAGVWDVRWTTSQGWTCSCPEPCCCHVSAVKALTIEEPSR